MPRITEATVESVARLARLSLSADERARFARELEAIVAWADSLQSLQIESLPPLHLPGEGESLRDDTPSACLPRAQALEPAPDHAEGLFRVPRILP